MITKQLIDSVIKEINDLEKEYQNSQGMILSEDDLKCHVFSKIKSVIPMDAATFNNEVKGSALHSEIKFFDEEYNLTIRPDLTIIEPRHLSIYHSLEFEIKRGITKFKNYSSKCFEIGGSAIMIELKFCRDKNGISDNDVIIYREDLEKINRVQKIVCQRSNANDHVYGVFAVFNKTNKGKEKLEILQKTYNALPGIYFIYATGNVDFSKVGSNISDTGYFTDAMSIC